MVMNLADLRIMVAAVLIAAPAFSQPRILTQEMLIKYTPEWKGDWK